MFNFKKETEEEIIDDCLHKHGQCPLCSDESDVELLYDLFGVEVCEGCYYDLINHMGYKNLDDLLEDDKKQLMKFLNELAKLKQK